MSEIYNFSINSLKGQPIQLSSFKGKVLLLVNTASECGLTPQYEGLQILHQKYHEQGLVIIGFPCNQFGQQEPGDAQQINDKCLVNYGVDFLITEKIDVNGLNRHPIFAYLTETLRGIFGNKVKWNFTKFLIGRNGKPLHRFPPISTPEKIEKFIQRSLAEKE